MFIRLDMVPACDRQTDRRNCFRYYSALHCKQCGRAVKIASFIYIFLIWMYTVVQLFNKALLLLLLMKLCMLTSRSSIYSCTTLCWKLWRSEIQSSHVSTSVLSMRDCLTSILPRESQDCWNSLRLICHVSVWQCVSSVCWLVSHLQVHKFCYVRKLKCSCCVLHQSDSSDLTTVH